MAYVVYTPEKVALSCNLIPIKGWNEIAITYSEDKRSARVSTDGDGRIIKNLNASGVASVKLEAHSPSNATFTALDLLDEVFPILCVDKSSAADLFQTDQAQIQKVPDFQKLKDGHENVWPLVFVKGTIVHSGAKEI